MRAPLLALLLACRLADAASARSVTDMAGRSVEIPDGASRVYSASFPLTALLMTLAPEKLVAINQALGPEQTGLLPPAVAGLPVVSGGPSMGRKISPEEILALRPDYILAWIGPFPDKGATERHFGPTGLPILYVRLARLEDYPAALDFLGGLLDREARAEALKAYIQNILVRLAPLSQLPPERRTRFYYAEGPDGLSTECADSFHLQAFRLAGGDSIDPCSQTSPKGMERITLEAILATPPSVIIAADPSFRERAAAPDWRNVATATGHIAVAPRKPFGWVDRPPSVMLFLGALWLGHVFHPDLLQVDLPAETRKFFKLFLNVDLSDDQLKSLLEF